MIKQEKQACYEVIRKRCRQSSRQEKVVYWMSSERYAVTKASARYVNLGSQSKYNSKAKSRDVIQSSNIKRTTALDRN